MVMGNNKSGKNKSGRKTLQSSQPGNLAKSPLKDKQPGLSHPWILWALLAVVITAFVYRESTSNGFVNWDDSFHIYENPNLVDNDPDAVRKIFSIEDGAVIGNFIPLTVYSFYLEKKLTGKIDSSVIHLNSLIMHLMIVFLVMWLLVEMKFSTAGAFFGALLFGIHPMRVESVAWATERKDVLFAFFFFAALITYVKWIRTDRKSSAWILYLVMFLFSILSGLSKIQAVTIPLSMLAIDYWLNRPISFRLIWEKTPFWILSLAIGLINIHTLNIQGSINEDVAGYSLLERLCIGTYSFSVYLYKFFIPWPMSPLYTYPREIPWYIYASPALFFSSLGIFYYWWKTNRKIWVFGTAFFFFNVMFLLQVVGAGQGFLADRFTYVAYFGLFAIAGWYFGELFTVHQNKIAGITIVVIITLVYGYMTMQQVQIWKDGITMWSHVIRFEKETNSVPFANRGKEYRDRKQYDKAIADFNNALRLNPTDGETYKSRGRCYFEMVMNKSAGGRDKEFLQQAISDFTIGLKYPFDKPKARAEMLANRGAAYAALGNNDAALADLNASVEIDPENKNAYKNRSVVYFNLGKYENAIKDYTSFIQFDKSDVSIWYSRGMLYRSFGKFDDAISDLNRALQLDAKYGLAYLERARAYAHKGDKQSAQRDYQQAQNLGVKMQPYDEGLLGSR
jgi:protein O-mannosyl-transferase